MTIIPFPGEARLWRSAEKPGKTDTLVLPVAPRINFRTRFASAAKATPALTPWEGLAMLDDLIAQGHDIRTVIISGPGDPLAFPESVFETLRLVKEKYPDLHFCLATLGIGGNRYAAELKRAGLTEVILLVDAVTRDVAENLYAWIRPGTRTMPLMKAAELLIGEQELAVTAFREAGVVVNIETTLYPGCNDGQMEEIAGRMAALGASSMRIQLWRPTSEEDSKQVPPDEQLVNSVRSLAGRHIKIMETGEPGMIGLSDLPAPAGTGIIPRPTRERPNVAVVSGNGMEVDLHLGQAVKILIYGPREDGLSCLLGTRQAPPSGGGGARWEELAAILDDCFALLAAGAGERPRKVLGSRGIIVLVTDGDIAGSVDVLYGGGRKNKK